MYFDVSVLGNFAGVGVGDVVGFCKELPGGGVFGLGDPVVEVEFGFGVQVGGEGMVWGVGT